MLSRPNECVAFTRHFLQRREASPGAMFNSRQEPDRLEQAKQYRTRGRPLPPGSCRPCVRPTKACCCPPMPASITPSPWLASTVSMRPWSPAC
ncbi:hypothetical protein MBH78_13265 [Oceanimonas sp. NS1]|nr:hypothetical protein [Oceanimonas sp. NS1]